MGIAITIVGGLIVWALIVRWQRSMGRESDRLVKEYEEAKTTKAVECACICSDACMGSCGDCGEGMISLHCRKCCDHPGLWHSLYG